MHRADRPSIAIGLLILAPIICARRDSAAVEVAFQAFRNSQLFIPRSQFRWLLFDSVEDAGGVVSRSNGTTWQEWIPGFNEAQLNEMFMSWTTPSVAWKLGLPPQLKSGLDQHVAAACERFCPDQAGACCKPVDRCQQMDVWLRKVLDAAQERFSTYFKDYEAQVAKVISAQWPFAQTSVLPYLIGAARLIEDSVWLSAFIWSRHGSNPTLQPCFEGEWGKSIQGEQMKMMTLWKDAHRCNEKLIWELLATSRFMDFRWAQMGMQIEQLKTCWQKMSDVLLATRRALYYSDRRTHQTGVDWIGSGAPGGDSLDAWEHGQYPGLLLSRASYFDEWFLDKPTLRYLIRHVFSAGESVAELGAFGGHYSTWLNDTGLVEAFAFDGIKEVAEITGGAVQTLDLGKPQDLGRQYDWVLCLEVGEHMPKEAEHIIVANLARHARKGAVISWATPDYPSPYHPNTMPEPQSTKLIESHGFSQHKKLTEGLRQAAETSWLKQTIGVYYKLPEASAA